MYIKPPENPGPPSWLPYVHVPNADRAFEIAVGTGAQGTVPPMEVPGGSRIANLIDPAGASFAVHSMPATGPMALKPAKAKAPAKSKAKSKPKAKAKPKAKKAVPARKKVAVKKKAPARKKVARKTAKKKSAPRKKSKTVRRKK
jgi:hypothetical protein